MKYKLIDSKYTINYTNSYMDAITKDKEIECFIGHDKKIGNRAAKILEKMVKSNDKKI